MVFPSIQPSSCRRRTNTPVHWLCEEADSGLRYPIIADCARAAKGQAAAAAPTTVMKSRRFVASPKAQDGKFVSHSRYQSPAGSVLVDVADGSWPCQNALRLGSEVG